MMKIRFLTLKMGGRLIHEFDLYMSKYGKSRTFWCISQLVYRTDVFPPHVLTSPQWHLWFSLSARNVMYGGGSTSWLTQWLGLQAVHVLCSFELGVGKSLFVVLGVVSSVVVLGTYVVTLYSNYLIILSNYSILGEQC